MGYLDSSTITVDAILTKRGRELLARNDGSFRITQFALGDDEIDYTLFNENHPNGSQYSGEAIENMSLIEAIPDENNIMRHKLITLDRGTSVIPFIDAGINIIKLAIGATYTMSPKTLNYNGVTTGLAEPNGYTYTIADRRLVTRFAGTGTTNQERQRQPYTGTALSESVRGSSISITSISATSLFGTNEKLLTTLTIEGNNTGARLTIPLEISKVVSVTTAATSDATPSESI
jgi:hypothetical protein|tara:strand:+ start:402 stop:1100 length:699 start_codon:yes stop_codon:yes gene_type:complete